MLYKGRAILQLALTFGKPGKKKKKKKEGRSFKDFYLYCIYRTPV